MVSSIGSAARGASAFSRNFSFAKAQSAVRPIADAPAPKINLRIDDSKEFKALREFLKAKEIKESGEIKQGADGLVVNVLSQLQQVTKDLDAVEKAMKATNDQGLFAQLAEKGENLAKEYNKIVKSKDFKRAKNALLEAESYRDRLDDRDKYVMRAQRLGQFDGSMLTLEMSQGNFATVSATRFAFERLEETRLSFEGGVSTTTFYKRNSAGEVEEDNPDMVERSAKGLGEVEAIIRDALAGLTGTDSGAEREAKATANARQSVIDFVMQAKSVEKSSIKALVDTLKKARDEDPQERRPLHVVA